MIERLPIDDMYDWHAARQQFIGASEVPIVMGLSTYASAAELYAEKKGMRPPRMNSALMDRGRWAESAVFQALADRRPEWIVQRAKVHVIDHERRLAATPDGFAQSPDRDGIGLVQAKSVSVSYFRDHWLLPESDGDLYGDVTIPPAYRVQTITERMLCGTDWCVLALLITSEYDWHFRLFNIDPDPVLEDQICTAVDKFWRDYLDANVMPPFELPADVELIRHLYGEDDGTEMDLTSDNRALVCVEELTETQKARKRLERKEESLKGELLAKLKNASFGRLADQRRLSARTQHRRGYAVSPKAFRVLRVLKAEPWKKNINVLKDARDE
jgi:predicted phage-related endonuclease